MPTRFSKYRKPLLIFSALSLLVVISAYGAYRYVLARPFITPEVLAEKRAEAAAQNEAAIDLPAPRASARPAKNPNRNVYFGDTHVHSRLSFDSYISGNRLSLDEAYRFAKGEALKNPAGELMQLTQPLDFAAITDHAEGFGLHEACAYDDKSLETAALCERFDNPNAGFFLELREGGEKRPMQRMALGTEKQAARFARSTWQHVANMAELHNEPGRFTSFIAYEYSPPLPDRGKIHRNIIFKNATIPAYAASAFDAATELDLWAYLERDCRQPCEAISIPHNPNKSWGLAFAGITIDGDVYTDADWLVRKKMEPLVEMFQIKGNSECAMGIATRDEACAFEQFLPICKPDAVASQQTGCIHKTSMARDGLKKGLLMESRNGTNPLDFGMIGSTDTHNSNPGDGEEWDYRGSSGAVTSPAKQRVTTGGNRGRGMLERNPGGLAAIWAEENTRDALFAAMQRKEVYATSGTRIRLRFHGGFGDMAAALNEEDPIKQADAGGVPMGGRLTGQDAQGARPSFLVWAMRDPDAGPLDKIQIIKSWVEDGETKEQVIDVVCGNGRVPNKEGVCPKAESQLDVTKCRRDNGDGAGELKAVWQDEAYRPTQTAFYYARVIEMPTCRWSSYDAIRLGITPPENMPASITEMAWSSPIWISPQR